MKDRAALGLLGDSIVVGVAWFLGASAGLPWYGALSLAVVFSFGVNASTRSRIS